MKLTLTATSICPKRKAVRVLLFASILATLTTLLSRHPNVYTRTTQQLAPTPTPTPTPTPVPCNRSLTFSRVPLPVTALASVQGSGNTWLRHLLQQLTGIYTGSKYNSRADPELWQLGYYGEGIHNGTVIAVKTHGLVERRYRYRRAIVVIRNPYDAMFADFNRRATGSHTGVAPAWSYVKYWGNFSQTYAIQWSRFHNQWMRFRGPLLLINFDDLVHSLETQVKKMADFLKHPSLTMDIRCALADSKGSSKRDVRAMTLNRHNVFSREQIQLINWSIGAVQKSLKKKFPKVSQAISSWKRNDTNTQSTWTAIRPYIS